MLSRHFFRSKVLQALYANQMYGSEYYQVELDFKNNIMHLNTLGLLQLSALVSMRQVAEQVMEDGLRKFMPSEEERNPSRRMVDNRLLQKMEDNFDFRKFCESAKISWGANDDVLRKIYMDFRYSTAYRDYVEASDDSFEADRNVSLMLFKAIVNSESVRALICDRSLLWEDDFDQIAQYNFMMLKELDDTFDESTPLHLMNDTRFEKDVADYEFALLLLKASYLGRGEGEELIKANLRGWDFERVALMDIIIINMAIAELTSCPSIPERVTVDEYIELSKEFSTDRSKLFVNGILDSIIIELRAKGRINKSGRGLAYEDVPAE